MARKIPAHWVDCEIENCDGKISPESEVQICYGCRAVMRYHLRQGPVHCVLYKAKAAKAVDRADKFNIAAGVRVKRRKVVRLRRRAS